MKRFNSKRLLALLMAAAMVFSCLPGNVLAAEGDENTYAGEITIEVGETKELIVPGLAVNEGTVEDNTKVTLGSVVGTPGSKELVEVTTADGFDGSKQYVLVSERSATDGLLTNEVYTATISWSGLQITGLKTNGAVSADTAHLWTIKFLTDKYEIKYGNQYLTFDYSSTSTASLADEASYVNLQRDGDYWYITNAGGRYLSNPGGFVNGYYGAAGFDEKGGSGWKFFEPVSSEASTQVTITGAAAGETTVRIGDLVYKVTVTAPSVGDGHNYENGFCTDTDCGAYQPAVQNADGVYQITNGGQLYWFAALVNGGETDADAILTENITVNQNVLVDGTLNTGATFRNWVPMSGYAGTFDGNSKTISGLYFYDTNAGDVGLFGSTAAAALVKNLTLADSYIAAKTNVGGVVGNNAGTIENCRNEATLTAIGLYLGGVAGNSTGLIDGCSNGGNIIASNRNIGGVVGRIENATIRNSYNEGTVGPKGTNVGGVVGQASQANVKNCYNEGSVDTSGATASSSAVGGVVGNLSNASAAVGCYNSGTVTGKTRVGGVFGSVTGTIYDGVNGESSTASKCYNTGTVTGNSYVGGVAGANDTGAQIANCYNAGTVDGPAASSGGVVGLNNFNTTLSNSYNIGTVVNGGGVAGANENVITNCYYLADSETDSLEGTTAKDEAAFTSGEVAYLLNGSTDEGDLVWKQTLGSGNAPAFAGEVVHYNPNAETPYYNGEVVVVHQHNYVNGFCGGDDCDAEYQSAELVDGVYQITNGGQLYWFMELVNAGTTDADAILVNDIYVNAGAFAANGTYTAAAGETVRNWVAMGASDAPYVGTFDGNGKTISGLYLNKTGTTAEDRFVGFVSYLGEAGTVKNLNIANSYFYGNRSVAAVVSQNKGTVEGCVNNAYVGSSDMTCGGVVATNYGAVKNCTNNGTVSSSGTSVGGVVGKNESAGSVTDCTNTGSVTSTYKYAGGIVGYNAGVISGGTNSGAVTGSSTAGGIAGRSTGNVSGSTNSGNITAGSDVGGIVGMANCNVTNSSNSGTVTASSGAGTAGIVGLGGGSVSGCYNTGAISGKSSVGGIVGQAGGSVSMGNATQTVSMDVSDCYNSGTVGGINNSYNIGGVVGYLYNTDSSVEDCYNIGTVSNVGKYAPQYVGAIVGRNSGTVTNSYYLTGCAKNGNNNTQYGIGAQAKSGSTADVAGATTGKTAEAFASGEVTWLLNGSTDEGELVWKQTLENDTEPKFAGEVVHYNADAGTPYFNGELEVVHQHEYVNGFCGGDGCDAEYQSAELVDGVYQIGNAGQLYWFANLVNTSGDNAEINAVLTANIVVNESLTGTPRAWTPIGYYKVSTDKVYYSGTFDGQGHTISGLYCVRPGTADSNNYTGLFGIVDFNGTVKNVGVVNSEFLGKNYVGGVAGRVYATTAGNGTVTGCWSDSKVSGNSHIGGVVGGNAGTISNCFNTGAVTGINTSTVVTTYTAGVVGSSNQGTVSNCYNTGTVTGTNVAYGVVGMTANNATIENNYYLADSETDAMDGTTAKTAAQFASGEVTWLLNGSTDEGELVWKQTLENDTTPKFEGEVVHYHPNAVPPYYNGEGNIQHQHNYVNGFCGGEDCDAEYEEAPLVDGVYQITNGGQLYWFAALVNGGKTDADAVLVNDIYVNQNVLNADGTLNGDGSNFRAWTPIGGNGTSLTNTGVKYTGTFDGAGHTVSGLYFSNANAYYVGLIGYLDGGVVKNVGVVDSCISARQYFAGVAGVAENGSTVQTCYNSGYIKAGGSSSSKYSQYFGGVIGAAKTGTAISDCYNTGTIHLRNYSKNAGGVVGGLITGKNDAVRVKITDAYNTGNFICIANTTGVTQIGGIVGSTTNADVERCWNSGNVVGVTMGGTGGIVGKDTNGSIIRNCYNQGTIDCPAGNAGGIVGQGSSQARIENCYNIGVVTSANTVNAGSIVGNTYNMAGEIVNCYYLSGSCTGVNGTLAGSANSTADQKGLNAKTAAQFASGEVTWLLNGSTDEGELVWKQTIGTDSAPAFAGDVVHYHADAQPPYYNGEVELPHQHNYVNGFCGGEDCDTLYEPAQLVDGVYQITNGGQLYWFAALVNGGETDADAVLMNDIYVNENVTAEGDFRAWTPINEYTGTFDGGEHAVSGLYFNDTTVEYVGLFGKLGAGGLIKNVTLAGSYFKGWRYVGGIVGYAIDANVTNCDNAASVNGGAYVGGVVGYIKKGLVTDCANAGIVTATGAQAGGIAGGVYGYSTQFKAIVSGCTNAGAVSGNKEVGGVVGHIEYGAVENCSNSATVTSATTYAGGVVGYFTGTSTFNNVINSFNTGDVSGAGIGIGGVVGNLSGGVTSKVENCYNTGNVTNTAGLTGGIVGRQASGLIRNCYNIGTVTGVGEYTGTIVGRVISGTAPANCYYLADSETDTLDGTTAKTAAQFASGEVTWLLNGSTDEGELVWKQTLGTDTAPKFEGEVVHYHADAQPPYYNGEVELPHQHNSVNGVCGGEDCDTPYEPAQLVDGVYQITNVGQLYLFAALVNGGEADADAVLVNDIFVNENVTAEGDYRAWTPIGGNGTWMSDYGVQYTGTFDGAGYTVSGLYFNNEGADYVGFIGTAGAGCTVKNLTLADSFIRGGVSVGGIVGTTISNNAITGCTNAATVQGTDYVGGIVGENYGADITDCVNEGATTGTMSSVGGIAGFHTNGCTIARCVNVGEVTAPNAQRVGGVVGEMTAGLSASPSVDNCYNTGAVSGKSYFGGVVGFMNSTDTAVRNSFTTTGVVVGKQMRKTSIIENCYYLSASETDTINGTTAKTAEAFASGEVAYLLNGSQTNESVVWKQTLTGENADATPKFTGAIVYAGYDSCAEDAQRIYTNDSAAAEKPDHQWDEATCEDPKTCAVCGATEGVALGHTWGDWVATKAPTLSEEGEETRECSVCGHDEYRAIEKLKMPFVDVETGSFYEAPVIWAVDNGITNGTDETHFSPLNICNRAQVVTFLWRAAGCPEPESTENPFVDVPETEFYYKAVLWAVENGITNGMDATHFGPGQDCNRAQVVTFLYRFYND